MTKKYFVGQTSIGGGPVISQIVVGEIDEKAENKIDELTLIEPVSFARMAMMVQTPQGMQTNFDTQAMDDGLFPIKRESRATVNLSAYPIYRITNEEDPAVAMHTAAFAAKSGLQATSRQNVRPLK